MAPVFLTAVVVIAIVLPAAGGPAYHGAFPLLALASGGLLLGVQHSGRVTSALSWRPLVGLGAISYGVYLFHFPVYVLMSADRVGHSGWQLLVGRVAVTLAIALASYWLIERPIRRATFTGRRTAMSAALAVGLAVVAIVLVPIRDATYWTASASAVAAAQITTGGPVVALAPRPSTSTTVTLVETNPRPTSTSPTERTAPATTLPTPTTTESQPEGTPAIPALNRPVRIIVLGDSTAQAAGSGLVEWAALNPTVAQVTVMAALGCGFIRAGAPIPDISPGGRAYCDRVLDRDLPKALHQLQPDVIIMMTTIPDILPCLFDRSVGPLTPVDPDFVTKARIDYTAVTNLILSNSSAHVVWIKPPLINPYWMDIDSEARDPVVHGVMEAVMGELATAHSDRVILLDLRTWMEQQGLDRDPSVRPDGIHFGPDGSLEVAQRWLRTGTGDRGDADRRRVRCTARSGSVERPWTRCSGQGDLDGRSAHFDHGRVCGFFNGCRWVQQLDDAGPADDPRRSTAVTTAVSGTDRGEPDHSRAGDIVDPAGGERAARRHVQGRGGAVRDHPGSGRCGQARRLDPRRAGRLPRALRLLEPTWRRRGGRRTGHDGEPAHSWHGPQHRRDRRHQAGRAAVQRRSGRSGLRTDERRRQARRPSRPRGLEGRWQPDREPDGLQLPPRRVARRNRRRWQPDLVERWRRLGHDRDGLVQRQLPVGDEHASRATPATARTASSSATRPGPG